MTMTKTDSAKIDKLFQKMEDIRVDTSAIKEHLRMLNHRTEKSEKSIEVLEEENKKQSVSIAKIYGIGLGAGSLGGMIVALIMYLIG